MSAALVPTGWEQADRGTVGGPTRLHIVGGPGSGKTTLARELARRLGVPAFELDTIAEQDGLGPGFRILCPLPRRLDAVNRIASLPGWVTDGSYLWWTEGLFRAADLIIWLDRPGRLGVQRILARHVREYVAGIAQATCLSDRLRIARRPHIRHLLEFVPYTWAYYHAPAGREDTDDGRALTRAGTARQLEPYREKVVRCTEHAEIATMLARLTRPVGTANTRGR